MKVDPFEAASFYLLYTLGICNTRKRFRTCFSIASRYIIPLLFLYDVLEVPVNIACDICIRHMLALGANGRALLTEPEILLLDEPTAGMDAFARRQMWNLLKKLNQQKLTILLTTHYMEEAETLCDRVGFMCGGRLEETDAPGHMIETLGRYAVDETSPDGLKSHYFHGKEEAIQYLSASEQETALRSTTLEDVFLETIGQQLECR